MKLQKKIDFKLQYKQLMAKKPKAGVPSIPKVDYKNNDRITNNPMNKNKPEKKEGEFYNKYKKWNDQPSNKSKKSEEIFTPGLDQKPYNNLSQPNHLGNNTEEQFTPDLDLNQKQSNVTAPVQLQKDEETFSLFASQNKQITDFNNPDPYSGLSNPALNPISDYPNEYLNPGKEEEEKKYISDEHGHGMTKNKNANKANTLFSIANPALVDDNQFNDDFYNKRLGGDKQPEQPQEEAETVSFHLLKNKKYLDLMFVDLESPILFDSKNTIFSKEFKLKNNTSRNINESITFKSTSNTEGIIDTHLYGLKAMETKTIEISFKLKKAVGPEFTIKGAFFNNENKQISKEIELKFRQKPKSSYINNNVVHFNNYTNDIKNNDNPSQSELGQLAFNKGDRQKPIKKPVNKEWLKKEVKKMRDALKNKKIDDTLITDEEIIGIVKNETNSGKNLNNICAYIKKKMG